MWKRVLTALCAVSFAVTLSAQTIGTYALWPDIALDTSGIFIGPQPADPARTYINLTPATSSGTIRMVAFRTAGASTFHPCPDIVKVKFFRRSGSQINFLAQSGPFTITSNVTKITLPTPVEVQAGDLIGITLLQYCGLGGAVLGPIGQTAKTEGSAFIAGDATGSYVLYPGVSTLPQARLIPAISLSIYGSSTVDAEVRSQIIVAAGSASGVGGSRFKTDIQMANVPPQEIIFNAPLRGDTVLGRLVYHPEGTSGTPSDLSVPFKLAAGESKTFLDFVGNLGLSGKGSVDVYTTVGFEPPLATARVYEDSSGSTKGLTLDAVALDRALTEDAVLFAPTDPTRFRMNIGVRTLDRPVSLGFAIFRANGTARTETIVVDYPANYYSQNEAGQLLGTALQAGDYVVVRAGAGPAFVYSSIVDNVSQDPSVQFASVLK
jgi:hypothetical protein